jgi:hypothetical protein
MGKETRKSFREDWIKRGFHLKTHCYARIIKKHHRKRVLDIHPEHPLKMKNNLPGMCLADNEMGVTTAIGIKCVRLRLTPTTTCKSKNGYGWSLWTASSFSNRRRNRVRERAKMDCLDEARHPLLHARPRPSASIAARARPKPPQTPAQEEELAPCSFVGAVAVAAGERGDLAERYKRKEKTREQLLRPSVDATTEVATLARWDSRGGCSSDARPRRTQRAGPTHGALRDVAALVARRARGLPRLDFDVHGVRCRRVSRTFTLRCWR